MSVLALAETFGSDASCNHRRVLVMFFVSLSVQGIGRIMGMTALVLGFAALLWFCLYSPSFTPSQSSRLLASATAAVVGPVMVAHAELFLWRNHPQPGEQSWTSFGQVRAASSGDGDTLMVR
jgi:hypothetical protein